MTRYLLTPKNLDLDQYDVASLIPTDGFKGENIEVELPKEILPIFNTPGGDMNRDNHYNMINKYLLFMNNDLQTFLGRVPNTY